MINEIKTDSIEYTVDPALVLFSLYQGKRWTFSGITIEWTQELDKSGTPTGREVIKNFDWLEDPSTYPSRDVVEAEKVRLQKLADDTKYQRQRIKEYPPMSDFADAMYWQQQGDNSKMEEYLAKIEQVKLKYPKP